MVDIVTARKIVEMADLLERVERTIRDVENATDVVSDDGRIRPGIKTHFCAAIGCTEVRFCEMIREMLLRELRQRHVAIGRELGSLGAEA